MKKNVLSNLTHIEADDFELFEKQYLKENESEIISIYDRHAGLVDGAKWQRKQIKKDVIRFIAQVVLVLLFVVEMSTLFYIFH